MVFILICLRLAFLKRGVASLLQENGNLLVKKQQISWSVFQIIEMSNSLGLIYRIVLRSALYPRFQKC
ncbi:hypothetical protein ERO13_D11G291066v2 [Gossypium hirsutum]|uniref:Uncharacterized protein n=1 Tax=Gossypium darwinii TaxID=34276 RepID=A0A5D2AV60_GOSDA|nr:hypothetical protein ERO13_D11G291066v2 [Gossypium hirsutum]TYG47416.1 hypothetical protein ES288_D11G336700v1 [Gossypium darwinii]